MEAIILCGGLATRLGDLAKDTPKSLMPVAGKPVLAHQVDLLRGAGVTRVILACGHLHERILAHTGARYRDVDVEIAVEEKRLDTGGAIARAMDLLDKGEPGGERGNEPFFALNGDVITDAPIGEMREKLRAGSAGVLLGIRVEDISSYGEILADGDKVLSFVEKRPEHRPGVINGGIYLFHPGIRAYFPKREAFSIEREVFPFVPDLRLYATRARWIDIGTPERLREAAGLFAPAEPSGEET